MITICLILLIMFFVLTIVFVLFLRRRTTNNKRNPDSEDKSDVRGMSEKVVVKNLFTYFLRIF